MFQYALGMALSIERNDILVIDRGFYKKKHKNTTYWPYKLNRLNIYHLGNVREISIPNFTYSILGYLKNILPAIVPYYIRDTMDGQMDFGENIMKSKSKIIILDGYWNSEKYFKHIREKLNTLFDITKPQSPKNREINKLILSTDSICLHVRRGDYISNPNANNILGVLLGEEGLTYYKNGINYITSKVSNPTFFIFSDDIKWAKDNLTIPKKYQSIFVDINDSNEEWEDMRLMKQCKHFIIANSTFSWWSAWLGSAPDKIVVCPKQWFTSSQLNPDINCDSWIKL